MVPPPKDILKLLEQKPFVTAMLVLLLIGLIILGYQARKELAKGVVLFFQFLISASLIIGGIIAIVYGFIYNKGWITVILLVFGALAFAIGGVIYDSIKKKR